MTGLEDGHMAPSAVYNDRNNDMSSFLDCGGKVCFIQNKT